MKTPTVVLAFLVVSLAGCTAAPSYDVVIRQGIVYDGTGTPGTVQDIGIQAARIVMADDLRDARATNEIDATGLAVAPGFINMLSHSETSLIGWTGTRPIG